MKKLLFLLILIFYLEKSLKAAEVSSEDLKALQDSVQDLTRTVQGLSAKVENQQERIQTLEHVLSVVEGAENQALKGQVGWTGSFRQGLSAFNPEIGVVADVSAIMTQSDEDSEGNDKISVREIELIFGHDIDPCARFDSTLTLSDFEEVSIEEAYITMFALPFDLRGRVGRMRPKVGKASGVHRDALDTADEPFVVQNYFGVEGLSRTGLELSWFIPVHWEVVTHELTVGIMEGGIGEEGTLFGETRKRPSFYAHLKNFWEISDVTNFELGGTYLLGSSDEDSRYEVNAFGIDATFIHHVDSIHRFKWQSEFYFQDRDEPFTGGEEHGHEEEEEELAESLEEDSEELLLSDFEDNPWGLYSLVDYRLSQRWSVGGRFDYLIPTDIDLDAPGEADIAGSVYLTFHQSEFARWRLQYQHVEFVDGSDDDRVFIQGTVVIGVHKHQLQ